MLCRHGNFSCRHGNFQLPKSLLCNSMPPPAFDCRRAGRVAKQQRAAAVFLYFWFFEFLAGNKNDLLIEEGNTFILYIEKGQQNVVSGTAELKKWPSFLKTNAMIFWESELDLPLWKGLQLLNGAKSLEETWLRKCSAINYVSFVPFEL